MIKEHYLRNYLSELPDFVFSYIEEYYNGESINTQLGYSLDVRVFLTYLRTYKYPDIKSNEDFTLKHIDSVTPSDLIRFKAYLREYETEYTSPAGRRVRRICRNSAFGINRKLSAVRGLFIYLYKTEQISQNVTDKVDFVKLHQKIKKPLTSQETLRLIDVIYNGEKYFEGRTLTEYKNKKLRDIAIFTTYLGTGVRVSELVNLKVTDVDFNTQSFIVTRKGGDQQEIFMPVQVNNALYEYLDPEGENPRETGPLFLGRSGKQLTVAAVEKTLKNYCYAVGITHPDKTRPHALRRTFACRLLEDGVDIKMVAELLGHKNIEVTHRYYAQYSSQKRREIMQGLDVLRTDEKPSEEMPSQDI
ncbi:MAG: tyrosine-type recombinase/integrase [Clostridia bacterium]|nr:tyrosine-type recombinase/integrase [Clostridia bacterium]